MNYAEQSRFFARYRAMAAASAFGVVATVALAVLGEWDRAGWRQVAIAALLGVATAYGIAYLPLYLRLSVETRKRYTWSVRARFVLVAVLALASAPLVAERRPWLVWAASLAIAVAGIVAARAHLRRNRDAAELPLVPALLFAGDLAAIFLVVGLRPASLVALAAALALSTMVFVVTSAGVWQAVGIAASALALLLLGAVSIATTGGVPDAAVLALPILVSCAALLLVRSADQHHAANVERTVEDLATFALVTPEYASEMLATATGILAANWRDSRPVGPDAVARWYEENSEYYLYDLAQFHLAYKHIAFMRDVISLAEGRVLDFGAGIGDLALELGRLGHDTVYVDVDGRTKAFARWRAERDWIPLTFASELDEVEGEFDTIISLDVFEHLAEPEPVIDALVDRLAPGGRMIVTAYFGATKAHPMHFDHDLDLGRFLEARGLVDAKSFAMRHLRSEFLRKSGVLVFEKR